MHPLLDPYAAILLDLNGTFMFGHDRFGRDQDYLATYRALGGSRLCEVELHDAVAACVAELDARYHDSGFEDCFPSVGEVLASLPGTADLPHTERSLIEGVIAPHECGVVPQEYGDAVRALASQFKLGLVSNIWSGKEPYVAELRRAGVYDAFEVLVFSSDGASIKPAPEMFEKALAALGVSRDQTIVVGDSLRCDVGGAASAGLASTWIDAEGRGIDPAGPVPNWIISDLRELSRYQESE